MVSDLHGLEDKVYEKLRNDDKKGLQPSDAQDILSVLDGDDVSERVHRLLEQLAEDKADVRDRVLITTSLLRICEAHRDAEENETGVAQALSELAREVQRDDVEETRILREAREEVRDASFDKTPFTRDDAEAFISDVEERLQESEEGESVLMDGLRSLAESLRGDQSSSR